MRTNWSPGRLAAAVALAGVALAFSTNAGAVARATIPAACASSIFSYAQVMTLLPGDMTTVEHKTDLIVRNLNAAIARPTASGTPVSIATSRALAETIVQSLRDILPWAQSTGRRARAEGVKCGVLK